MKFKLLTWMLVFCLSISLAYALDNPSNLQNVNISFNSFVGTWDNVVNASQYEVRLNQLPEDFNILIINTSNNSHTFEDLKLNTLYEWRVKAINETTHSNFTTQQTPTLSRRNFASIDFSQNINIVIFIVMILIVILLSMIGLFLYSGVLLFLITLILFASGINLLICFICLGITLILVTAELV